MKRTQILLLIAGALALASAEGPACAQRCGDFRGMANFDQGLTLTATSNAPAGAKGKAEFIAVNDNGTNYEMLFVKTSGLTNSVYTVQVTDNTGTNVYDLGTLNETEEIHPFHGFRRERRFRFEGHEPRFPWFGGTNQAPAGWTNWVQQCAGTHSTWTNLLNPAACSNLFTFATNVFFWYTNTLTVGSGSFVLPSGLSQTNAAEITVSDTNGTVYLTGDFTSTTNSTVKFKEVADVVAGTATNAQGTATITYRLVNSRTLGTFRLAATGLPGREKLFLTANGTNTIRVWTRNTGSLVVRGFPHIDVATIENVVATDISSNVVFSVNF